MRSSVIEAGRAVTVGSGDKTTGSVFHGRQAMEPDSPLDPVSVKIDYNGGEAHLVIDANIAT